MCNQCHQKVADVNVLEQWTEALENPQFERWNSTSLNHLYLTCYGVNGLKAQTVALKLLANFIEWGKTSDNYGAGFVLEAAPVITWVEAMYYDLKELADKMNQGEYNQEKIKSEVFEEGALSRLYSKNYESKNKN